jgi:hypothetical protein
MRRDVRAAVVAIVIFGVGSSAASLIRTLRSERQVWRSTEAISNVEIQRAERLRSVVQGHGVVGYIQDRSDGVPQQKQALVQYAVAPVVVLPSLEPEVIIGNLTNPSAATELMAAHRLILVVDCGDGIMVFRHAETAH